MHTGLKKELCGLVLILQPGNCELNFHNSFTNKAFSFNILLVASQIKILKIFQKVDLTIWWAR